MHSRSCLNCAHTVQGNYCSYCGQKSTVQKLTWKSLFEEILHFFTHAEHSFIYTSKRLVSEPGMVVKEFLEGKRKKIHKPITFLLIWAAIFKLTDSFFKYCSDYFGMYTFKVTEPALRIMWTGPKNVQLLRFENLITILIEAPVLVVLGWVVFRKTRNSFVENWVAILYALSFSMMVSALLPVVGFLFRLFHLPVTRGFVNDFYFVCYFFATAWVIFSFEKVNDPRSSRAVQLVIALALALFVIYADDLVWYGLFRFIPA